MNSVRRQQTIARRAQVAGFGYWSGKDVTIEFRPAPADSGIAFIRSDMSPQARIPAKIEHRVHAPRRTNLRRGPATVEMVEHVLAALAGLHIDNCEIWTNASEMPGCDGSSAPFVEALTEAHVVELPAAARQLVVADTIRVEGNGCSIEARPADDDQCHIEFRLDYPQSRAIGRQVARATIDPDVFRLELAGCRTFLLQSEAEQLRKMGLGLKATPRDLLVFDDCGPVDNCLRFANECARHKALDVLGDLALAGRRIVGRIIADRSGHRLHAELTKRLVEQFATASLRASA